MITSIELDRMRHAEYIQFSKDCAAIVGANDPDAMNVRGKYDAFINKTLANGERFVL
jgi:hypothetical protein